MLKLPFTEELDRIVVECEDSLMLDQWRRTDLNMVERGMQQGCCCAREGKDDSRMGNVTVIQRH